MITFLVLKEPKSAEYIFIDSQNKVHLLLPVVGGETVGIDNTCKTAMEMQHFFHGEDSQGAGSALAVLADYAKNLKEDIDFLQASHKYNALLDQKKERLIQIQEYYLILSQMEKPVESRGYAEFPPAIQRLLKKQTNCLSVHLSPFVPDSFLRTTDPVFSVKRVQWSMNFRRVYSHKSLVYHLKKALPKLLVSRLVLVDPKQTLTQEIIDHYGETKPKLGDLQAFVQRKVFEQYSEQIDFSKSSQNAEINSDYFLGIVESSYEDLSLKDALFVLLNAAVGDPFWAGLQKGILDQDTTLTPDEKTEKVNMAIQFFFACINIYCKHQGLSTENFGVALDANAESIIARIRSKDPDLSIEDLLFTVVESHVELKRPLNQQDKDKIKKDFIEKYNIIKDSPHMDEFIFLIPEVRGDFFNHRGRISAHFLDLFGPADQHVIEPSSLNTHVALLKASQERLLSPHNDVGCALDFGGFLKSITAVNVGACADDLCYHLQKKSDLTTQLNFKELDLLLNHPQWPAMRRLIITHEKTDKANLYTQAIDEATAHLNRMHEKLLCSKTEPNVAVSLTDDKWIRLTQLLENYREVSLSRRKKVPEDTELNSIIAEFKHSEKNIGALNHALMSLNALIQAREANSPGDMMRLGPVIQCRQLILTECNLQATAIGCNPNDPEQEVLNWEQIQLGELKAIKCLHHLKSSWWTPEGMAVLKQIPAHHYTYDTVSALNKTESAGWDQWVLKSVQTGPVTFDNTLDLDALRGRCKAMVYNEVQKKIDTAKECYTAHLQKKWFDIGGQRTAKNALIQQELGQALNRLNRENPDVAAALEIIKAVKSTIEARYGATTWSFSWFKLSKVVPESGKVLQDLIGQLSLLDSEKTSVVSLRV